MVRTPHYYKGQMANPQNMLAFYRFVADRSPLPVIIYNFPQATGYDIPAEVVLELAEHPNLIGIKESSGSIEKVQKMAEGTRHIKRSATVTETFAAATGRMRTAAIAASASAEGAGCVRHRGRASADCSQRCFGERRGRGLGDCGRTSRNSCAETVVSRGHRRGRPEDSAEGSWLPGAGRRCPEVASFARCRRRGRDPGICRLRSDCVLRNLRGVERGRRGPGS